MRPIPTRLTPAVFLLAAAGAIFSAPAAAQDAPPYAVSVTPRVGILSQPVPFRQHWRQMAPEFHQVWEYRLDAAAVYGAAIDVVPAGSAWGFRVEGNHAPRLRLRHLPDGGGPGLMEDQGHSTITTLTAAATFQPPAACAGPACLRLLAGAGTKRYTFDVRTLADDIVDQFADDQRRLTVQLGAGAVFRVRQLTLAVEANDYSNTAAYRYRDNASGRVHDLVVSAGGSFHLR